MNYYLICNPPKKKSAPADSPDATISVNPKTATLTYTYQCHELAMDSVCSYGQLFFVLTSRV